MPLHASDPLSSPPAAHLRVNVGDLCVYTWAKRVGRGHGVRGLSRAGLSGIKGRSTAAVGRNDVAGLETASKVLTRIDGLEQLAVADAGGHNVDSGVVAGAGKHDDG